MSFRPSSACHVANSVRLYNHTLPWAAPFVRTNGQSWPSNLHYPFTWSGANPVLSPVSFTTSTPGVSTWDALHRPHSYLQRTSAGAQYPPYSLNGYYWDRPGGSHLGPLRQGPLYASLSNSSLGAATQGSDRTRNPETNIPTSWPTFHKQTPSGTATHWALSDDPASSTDDISKYSQVSPPAFFLFDSTPETDTILSRQLIETARQWSGSAHRPGTEVLAERWAAKRISNPASRAITVRELREDPLSVAGDFDEYCRRENPVSMSRPGWVECFRRSSYGGSLAFL